MTEKERQVVLQEEVILQTPARSPGVAGQEQHLQMWHLRRQRLVKRGAGRSG
jgi:hypothetical protein